MTDGKGGRSWAATGVVSRGSHGEKRKRKRLALALGGVNGGGAKSGRFASAEPAFGFGLALFDFELAQQ
jgi:hypothetical protein